MLTLPIDSSPPKSGWSLRVPPLLMKLMYPAEPGSTGAVEMSRFHQLVAGRSGSGPGNAPPATGTEAGHCADAAGAANRPMAAAIATNAVFNRMTGTPHVYCCAIMLLA